MMSDSNNKLFRQEALDRLSSPEQLDKLINIVNRRSWIPLATTGTLVLVATIWSIVGRIPVTVQGQGVLIQPRRVIPLQAPGAGMVGEVYVKVGDRVNKGDVIGKIAQPGVQQQLEQERIRLRQLLSQKQQSSSLQTRQLNLEKQNLQQQKRSLELSLQREGIVPSLREENLKVLTQNRSNLESSLSNLQKLGPILRDKSLKSLEKQEIGLRERIQQIKALLPTLETRLASLRKLLDEQLISGDALISAEREYFENVAQLSNLETQLQELEVQKTQTEKQFLDNQNAVDNIKAQMRELNVQEVNVQREYLQSLNRLDEINDRIDQIDSQVAQLEQEQLETSINKTNPVEDTKRRIEQLETELQSKSQIISQKEGKILEIAVVSSQMVDLGTRIGTIEIEDVEQELVGIVYLLDKDGKKVQPGMSVQITPNIVKRERFGGIVGQVTKVSSFPVTAQNVATIVGSQELAQNLQAEKGLIEVYAQLELNPNNISGYQWSSSQGPNLELTPGTTTITQIKVGELAPISFIIPLFRSWTGIY